MIKFRARCLDGKIHCGDLLHSFCDGKDVYEIRECTFYKNSAMTSYQRYHTVRSEIAQLVGYDADGNEIFSNDDVVDAEDGNSPWGGNPRVGVVDEDGNFLGDIGDTFEGLRLRKKEENSI